MLESRLIVGGMVHKLSWRGVHSSRGRFIVGRDSSQDGHFAVLCFEVHFFLQKKDIPMDC